MTDKRIAQTNQQQKSDKPQGRGILQRAAVRSVADAEVQSTDAKEAQNISNSAFSFDFSQVPISTTKPQQFQARKPRRKGMPPIQAKLIIGEPNDRYEQEADRVAKEVVQRINTPSSPEQSVQRRELKAPPIRSFESQPGRLGELKLKPLVQRQEDPGRGEAASNLESSIKAARGGGQPLEASLQQSMGQAMRADFSGVRVHRDAQSDQLNQSIQAKAFTTGLDVFFRQGEYNPVSRKGQELIAHELTHTMQQKTMRGQPERLQRMEEENETGEPQAATPQAEDLTTEPLPAELYHRTTAQVAQQIVVSGLLPLSTGGEERDARYLCMADSVQGTASLNPRMNDIIFKVKTEEVPQGWYKRGAGAGGNEWRTRNAIEPQYLWFRRAGGNNEWVKKWRSVTRTKVKLNDVISGSEPKPRR